MVNRVFWFGILMLVFGCKHKNNPKESAYSREEFKYLLGEIHIMEGQYDHELFTKDSIPEELILGYDSLFLSHETNFDEFEKTYRYYLASDPAELDSIYTELKIEFQEKADSLVGVPNYKKVRPDSQDKKKKLLNLQKK